MMVKRSLLLIAAAALLAGAVWAADPPSMPKMNRAKPVLVGPDDSLDKPMPVRGKVDVFCRASQGVTPTLVEVFLDDSPVGMSTSVPYKVILDTATVADGEHILKAIGKDAEGKEVWSAKLKIKVKNASVADDEAPGMLPGPGPDGPAPGADGPPPGADNQPMRVELPESMHPAPPPPMGEPAPDRPHPTVEDDLPPGAQPPAPVPGPGHDIQPIGAMLGETYTSKEYGFSISYPSGWAVKDKMLDLKPQEGYECWVQFSQPPMEVNVRAKHLQPGTDADVFAKYNPYVQTWERKSIAGRDAFSTVTQIPAQKKAIHRLILVDRETAWMLNCTDSSGTSPQDSYGLFEDMVKSLKVTK